MLRAHKNFGQFRGTTEQELLAWLRQILVNNLAKFVEQHMLAARRDVRREVSIERLGAALEQSTDPTGRAVAGRQAKSPSMAVQQREEAVVLADRLAQLPARLSRGARAAELAGIAVRRGRPADRTARSAQRGCCGCGRSRSCARFIGTRNRVRPDVGKPSTSTTSALPEAEQDRLARILDDYLVADRARHADQPRGAARAASGRRRAPARLFERSAIVSRGGRRAGRSTGQRRWPAVGLHADADDRRLPAGARDRPRRHGRRLRSVADFAAAARRAEDPAVHRRRTTRSRSAASRTRPRPPPRCSIRTSCRCTPSASRTACTTTRCSSIDGQSLTSSAGHVPAAGHRCSAAARLRRTIRRTPRDGMRSR